MSDDGYMFVKHDDSVHYYEERARQDQAAAESAASPTRAAAHRMLAIEYSAEARDLRRLLAAKV